MFACSLCAVILIKTLYSLPAASCMTTYSASLGRKQSMNQTCAIYVIPYVFLRSLNTCKAFGIELKLFWGENSRLQVSPSHLCMLNIGQSLASKLFVMSQNLLFYCSQMLSVCHIWMTYIFACHFVLAFIQGKPQMK